MSPYHTSPGGRTFGLIFGTLAAVIGAAALWWAARFFVDGDVTISLGRRGGGSGARLHLGGWRAWAYGTGALMMGAAFASAGTALLLGGLAPARAAERVGPIVWRLLRLAGPLLIGAGVIAFIVVVSRVASLY